MKYQYRLYDYSSVFLADIPLTGLPEEVTINGQQLFVKDEFHITLVSIRYLAEQIQATNQESVLHQLIEEFETFTEKTSLEKYTISNDFRFVQDKGRTTVIVMAEVLNLDKFFERLNQKFSIKLPKQPTHVTLYRYPKDFIGIGIPSAEVLANIANPLEITDMSYFKTLT
jgi:hypothetical protein